MFYYRVFHEGDDVLLAIADTSIVGKDLEEGKFRMHVSKEFYGNDRCEKEKAKVLAKQATIINAVGNKIVSLLIREGLVDDKMVLRIQGVPHAQVISV